MPSFEFPTMGALLKERVCPWDKFDALYKMITVDRKVTEGYFVCTEGPQSLYLCLAKGSPYAAGKEEGGQLATVNLKDFFTFYHAHAASAKLSFFVAEAKLIRALLIVFQKRSDLHFTTDMVDMDAVIGKIGAKALDALVALRVGGRMGFSLCTKGRPSFNYFTEAAPEAAGPPEQLVAYVRSQPTAEVDIYEDIRVGPAADIGLVTPEALGRLTQVFSPTAPAAAAAPPIEELQLESIGAAAGAAAPPTAPPAPEPVVATGQIAVAAPPPPAAPSAPAAPPPPAARTGPVPELILMLAERVIGTYPVAHGELTIGRNPGNDIPIDNVGVSRRHAIIKEQQGKYVIEDLGSANGTFVNGEKITTKELKDGDEIFVVKHRLLFKQVGAGAPEPAPAKPAGAATMMISPEDLARLATGMGATPTGMGAATGTGAAKPAAPAPPKGALILPDGQKTSLDAPAIMIGSGEGVQVKLEGLLIAKNHARIVQERPGQFKLVHTGGLSATRVNGEKVTEKILRDRDEIEIGKYKLVFRLER